LRIKEQETCLILHEYDDDDDDDDDCIIRLVTFKSLDWDLNGSAWFMQHVSII